MYCPCQIKSSSYDLHPYDLKGHHVVLERKFKLSLLIFTILMGS